MLLLLLLWSLFLSSSKNMTCARPRCKATPSDTLCKDLSLYFTVQSSHAALHLLSSHLISSHLISSHLLISCHLFSDGIYFLLNCFQLIRALLNLSHLIKVLLNSSQILWLLLSERSSSTQKTSHAENFCADTGNFYTQSFYIQREFLERTNFFTPQAFTHSKLLHKESFCACKL